MRLDLHIHSTASDGAFTPRQVVNAAVAGGLDVIAISDHDTIAGYRSADEAAAGLPLQIIPAIEASSTRNGREFHFLGYFVDPAAPVLVAHEGRAIGLRHDRIARMVALLERDGIEIDFEAVLEEAGPEGSSLGRPHLARALVSAGYVSSVPEAFDRLIGDCHPAFIPTELLSPAEAIELILRSGGIPIWAHPPGDALEPLLPELIEAGLRGIEVYRPRSQPSQVARLEAVARRRGLLTTGGSDWHTPDSGAVLGDFTVRAEDLGPFLEAAGM